MPLDDWFEVFRTGFHKDSKGKVTNWTEATLDTIVAKYNPAQHEAPFVIGHPEINKPAWGWTAGLKRDGQRLLAKGSQVVPEFAEMVEKGLFKKRSISLYPDLTLRHIGFLGAQPPAVKGLADIAFADDDNAVTIEFMEDWKSSMMGRIMQRLREWIIDKFDTDTADRVVGQWEIDELKREPPTSDSSFSSSSNEEEDMDKEKIQELETKVNGLMSKVTQFSEADKTKETQIATLRSELDAERKKTKRQEFASFCDSLIDAGTLTPAQKGPALDFMEILDGEKEYEFSEPTDADANAKAKKAPIDAFKAFLQTLPKQIEFGERATKGAATTQDFSEEAQVAKTIASAAPRKE